MVMIALPDHLSTFGLGNLYKYAPVGPQIGVWHVRVAPPLMLHMWGAYHNPP
jgi:hypothetical protein